MESIKHRFAELLNLTQIFLLREYSLKEVHIVDPAILDFFQSKMQSPSDLPAKNKVQSPPLVTSMEPIQSPKSFISVSTVPSSTGSPPPKPRPEPTASNFLPSTQPEPSPPIRPEPSPPTRPEPSPPIQPESLPPNPKPPAIQDNSSKTKGLVLEPLAAAYSAKDFREFWKLCPALFPDWILCETVPSDVIAQKHKNAWLNDQIMTPVIILAFDDEEKQLTFLKNIAQAISLRLAPTRVLSVQKLEKENSWENVLNSSHLSLIIACDYGLYLQPKLMRFYREEPQQSKHFLNQIPLLLLSDLPLYLKEPQLKPLLWRAICNEFAASQQR